MTDESLPVRRKIGLEWGYDGRKYAANALTRRQNLGFRHRQRKAESWNPGKLNGADGISDIEGKGRRGDRALGSERVSMERAGRWAEHPPSLTTLRRAIRAGSKSTDQSWQFLQTAEDVVRFFIVLAWVDKPPVGDGDDTHLRRFGRGDARKRVLHHKACVGGETEFVRRAQIDVGSGFAAFNFFASNNDFETSGQFMSI